MYQWINIIKWIGGGGRWGEQEDGREWELGKVHKMRKDRLKNKLKKNHSSPTNTFVDDIIPQYLTAF